MTHNRSCGKFCGPSIRRSQLRPPTPEAGQWPDKNSLRLTNCASFHEANSMALSPNSQEGEIAQFPIRALHGGSLIATLNITSGQTTEKTPPLTDPLLLAYFPCVPVRVSPYRCQATVRYTRSHGNECISNNSCRTRRLLCGMSYQRKVDD
jgi:hypothetical protein